MNIEKRQLEFGENLRRLRLAAGYTSGKDFADRLRWQPSKVSRIENGRTPPAVRDVEQWLAAVDAPESAVSAMLDDLREIRLARDSWKRQLRTGHAVRQRIEADAEQHAQHITSVELYLVPGLVQTADYARAVFELAAELHRTPRDTDAAVRERVRRQEVLYDSSKTIEVLVDEFALSRPICPASVMRAQLDRLATISGLDHVAFGVIPIDASMPTISMHGYTILDDAVLIEVNHTELTVTDPEDVALHRRITEQLWKVAATGDDARAILARLLD